MTTHSTTIKILVAVATMFTSPALAGAYANNQIVEAIYHAEGGSATKYPYGIKSVHCANKEECRQVCLTTIKHNRRRFAQQTKYDDFINFLASRYCPVDAENDKLGLNKNWIRNVKFWLNKQQNKGGEK